MPQGVLVRVQKCTLRVLVVARTAVRVQGEDVGPDDALDGEVRRVRGVERGVEAEDGHFLVLLGFYTRVVLIVPH